MEKQFCTYEIALKLKELGFNENCIATFGENQVFDLQDFEQNYDTFPSHIIAAPLWQQVIDWFRDKQNIKIELSFANKDLNEHEFAVFGDFKEFVTCITDRIKLGDDRIVYKSYPECREQAILKAIEFKQKI
jgi:hypothetical protein